MAGAGALLGVMGLKLGRMTPELLRKAVARYRQHQKAMAKEGVMRKREEFFKKPQVGRAFLKDTQTGFAVDTGQEQIADSRGNTTLVDAKPVLPTVENAKTPNQVANLTSQDPRGYGSKEAQREQKAIGKAKYAKRVGQKPAQVQQAVALNQPIAKNQFATPNNKLGAVSGYSVKQPDKPKVVNPGVKPVVNAPTSNSKKSKQEYAAVHSDFFGS